MTECIQERFSFTAHFSRCVQAEFTAGRVSSDGGALLLREADRRINLLGRLASCFLDGRAPLLVKHGLSEMLSQRIYGLALGYEDLCDHEQLRSDPLLGLLSGKRDLDGPLAGKSTLNRLELTGRSKRYHKISYSTESIDRLLTDLYLESHAVPPEQIVLDLDATDIPLYGHQPERFFHGYYDHYCYLPLYIFAGDQLLCARLRPANQDGAAGSLEEVSRIVTQLRQRWPEVSIVLRADSGFCREQLMGWCEQNHVDYVFGLARNKRLAKIIGAQMHQAAASCELHDLSRVDERSIHIEQHGSASHVDQFTHDVYRRICCSVIKLIATAHSTREQLRFPVSRQFRTQSSFRPRPGGIAGWKRRY